MLKQLLNYQVNTQSLTSTSNNDQTVAIGSAISDIIFTWGGDASGATVNGLPGSGIVFTENTTAKTITISGTPTANVSFSLVTYGPSGTPVNGLGSITTVSATPSDQIHNFTTSNISSSFYNFLPTTGTSIANLSTSKGTVSYDGLTLTQCLKMETNTSITFTTTHPSTLTLVMNTTTTDPTAQIKLDGTNRSDASGIISLNLAAGNHTIAKSNSANLFFMKTTFGSLGVAQNNVLSKLTLYPNPVSSNFSLSVSNQEIKNVMIYSLTGALVKSVLNNTKNIDVSDLQAGSYIVKVTTDQDSFTEKIIKK